MSVTAREPSADPKALSPFGRTLGGLARYAFGAGFVLASAVTATIVFVTAAAPGARAAPGGMVLSVLGLNLLLILALAGAAGWRALQLFGPRAEDAGVRLHRRFVALFSLAAVLPAVIVALFFGLLVTRGVESWFSSRVRTVVENAATTSRVYVREQENYINSRMGPMVADLNRPAVADVFAKHRLSFSALLSQAVARDFAAIYVLDADGRVLARAEAQDAPAYLAPPPDVFRDAARGGTPNQVAEQEDVIRAFYRLSSYPDAYLELVRRTPTGMLNQLRQSAQALQTYREAEQSRTRAQAVFAMSYASTALLVLIGAVWVGLGAATQITTPVARLVQAADKVAGGDLSARVPTDKDPEEIAVLSRAFNRMTGDLQAQQAALKTASVEAQTRSRFIEAVLAGVSAGVVGLDATGRISAANEGALALLGLDETDALGRAIGEAAPELAPVAERARDSGQDAEAEIDLVRGAETRRLRVRASGRPDGLVLTFDDITRLVAAQRNAAWRDVARRIAHEIKNPLTPIQLSAERLQRKYRGQITGDRDTFDRCTETIIRQVGDIGRMVDEFSAFARMPTPKFAEEDGGELLRQAVFAQRVAYPEIPVELEDQAGQITLLCDGRMIGQALTNVLKNAGESVAARTALEAEHRGGLTARLIVGGDGMAAFEVEDTGIGLPERDRERLTEPYVTTREKGTGLGLAIVKRIMEEHGGELVLADARIPPGALVRLLLPIQRTVPTPSAA